MGQGHDAQLEAIDTRKLTPVVRQVLNSPSATVIDWRREQLSGGVGLGTAVHRLSGRAEDNGQLATWSLILKELHPISGQEHPSCWAYWKREAEVYRSGWLENLPGGIAAPRCYGVEERPDGSYWLWLEDVKDDIGRKWPLEHYGVVARHLGQFNGAYLTNEPMPTYPWLSREEIRKQVESSAPAIEQLRQVQDHPRIRRFLARGVGERIFRIWEEHHWYYALIDRLPQTIYHYDALRRNMFARRILGNSYKTIMIDWAYVGYGPIGAELTALVKGTASFLDSDPSRVRELEDIAVEGYIEGLREVGWKGDPRLVRLGYMANIRFGIGSIEFILHVALDDPPSIDVPAIFGCSAEELLDHGNALWMVFQDDLQVHDLAESLGFY